MFIEHFLTPIDDLEAFCEKYGLQVDEYPCKKCGNILKTDTPFVTKEMRGLYAKECTCGNKNTPFSYVIVEVEK
jgi:hypothetical protein